MATTPDTTALQKGALTYAQPEQTGTKKAVDLMSTLLSTPTLPTGTSIAPQLQTIQTGELQTTPGVTGTVVAGTPTALQQQQVQHLHQQRGQYNQHRQLVNILEFLQVQYLRQQQLQEQ